MGWRMTMWAIIFGFSGAFGGLYAGAALAPTGLDAHRAPGYGLIAGAFLGGLLGVAYVWLTHPRRSGD
jgi:hypothetical protein